MTWRIYAFEGINAYGRKGYREFGIDYGSLAAAQAVRDEYRKAWGNRYQIRKVH